MLLDLHDVCSPLSQIRKAAAVDMTREAQILMRADILPSNTSNIRSRAISNSTLNRVAIRNKVAIHSRVVILRNRVAIHHSSKATRNNSPTASKITAARPRPKAHPLRYVHRTSQLTSESPSLVVALQSDPRLEFCHTHPLIRAQYGAPPPMPPGWVAQFDQNSQKWYYIDQATGRSQWEPPAHAPPPQGPYAPPPSGPPGAPYGQGAAQNERGLFGASHDQSHGGYPTGQGDPYAPGAGHGDPYGEKGKDKKEKKDKGHSTAMLAAAGIGGVAAGAWIGHELSKS